MVKLFMAFFAFFRGLVFERKEEYTFSSPHFNWKKMGVVLMMFFLAVYSTWLSYAYLNLGNRYIKLRDSCELAKKEPQKSSDSHKGK